MPPYSSVSAIEGAELKEISNSDLDAVEESWGANSLPNDNASAMGIQSDEQERLDPEIAEEGVNDSRPVSAAPEDSDPSVNVPVDEQDEVEKPPPPKKKSQPEDENQLSLFGAIDVDTEIVDATFATDEEEAGSTDETVDSEQEELNTEIIVYLLLDSNKKLYLRGDPPFSWDKGVLLSVLDVGKYASEAFKTNDSINVCFHINDHAKQKSEICKIQPNMKNECYPEI